MAGTHYCIITYSYNCTGAPLRPPASLAEDEQDAFAWWTDRQGQTHVNFDDKMNESDNSGNMNNSDTHDACAMGSSMSRNFVLRNARILPVTALNFGLVPLENNNSDNNNNKSNNNSNNNKSNIVQQASFHVGPMVCKGRRDDRHHKHYQPNPRSCADLKAAGLTQMGYYMVESSRSYRMPEVVFCDMKRVSDAVGFERRLGNPGDLRSIVAFDVSIDKSISDAFRSLSFSKRHVLSEVNAELDLTNGRFVVQHAGVYLFIVHGQAEHRARLQIQRNHRPVAHLRADVGHTMVGQSVVLVCAEGDEIRLFNFGGDLFEEKDDNHNRYLHFVGILLHAT